MAFSEIELKRIDNTVGAICRRIPAHVRDQVRMIYEIEGHAISLYEERPGWKDPNQWTKYGIAKFRYFRSRREWKLYWMRQDMKWHEYDPGLSTASSLEALAKIVDEDTHGAFFWINRHINRRWSPRLHRSFRFSSGACRFFRHARSRCA